MEKSVNKNLRESALKLIRSHRGGDEKHALQVAKLSVSLFDQLASLHNLDASDRELLEAAALLHDIGWHNGRKEHHKTSRNIIIRSRALPMSTRRRVMAGLIARYHRKKLPQPSHRFFSLLDERSKATVNKLAALLRFADGLDAGHNSSVKDIKVFVSPLQITVPAFALRQ